MPVISGTAYWAKVHQPHFDQYNEQGIFSIDVTVDAKTKKQLQDLGLGPRIKTKGDERGEFITIKRKYTRKDGTKNLAPRVVDSKRTPISSDILIGNGSLVNVAFDTYDYNVGGNKGVGASLTAVQVVKLVQYSPSENLDEFEEESGYQAPTNGASKNELEDDKLPF